METTFLKNNIASIINKFETLEISLQAICDFLKQEVSYYDWVGFYFKNGDIEELKPAQFAGEPTEHTIIPFEKEFVVKWHLAMKILLSKM